MATTNANTQMLLQLLQERNQGQGNQGNQGQGQFNNQPQFATLNQFLANQPKTFSACVEAMDADDWLVDINKHFECSNVRPEDYVKFASFQLKDQAANWYEQYKDSRGVRVITWTDFFWDFRAHHIPTSVVENMHEQFRNLKQGGMSVYQYNTKFQNLSRYARQEVPDGKSMIYHFRGGLREDLQLAPVLVEPTQFDQFYNMALKQEAAQLKSQAEDSSDVIMGNLSVNSIPAKVLFDPGASLSFISRPFVSKHDFVTEKIPIPQKVVSSCKKMTFNACVPDASIKMGNYSFLAPPKVLGDSDIDLILGMDWLSKHKDFLDCAAKEIKLTHPSEYVIIFAARDETIRLLSLNEKGEINTISQIPVVCEYEDDFPEELPEKVASIVNWEPPQNVKQLHSFLGLASYCRIFVENFSKIAKPLSNLLQKHVKYSWTPEYDVAFDTLKEKLIIAPVLTPPDESKPYEVFCDASLQGLSGVLMQDKKTSGHFH
ncbi:uncharacterized protein [Aegilops tauschii subsp. strangulata]|uniref:uncharacterized protein n=1 Tax=Aegilops tauschii subsp. strangulata TaxID=200361 RepID=UPI003CC84258